MAEQIARVETIMGHAGRGGGDQRFIELEYKNGALEILDSERSNSQIHRPAAIDVTEVGDARTESGSGLERRCGIDARLDPDRGRNRAVRRQGQEPYDASLVVEANRSNGEVGRTVTVQITERLDGSAKAAVGIERCIRPSGHC